LSSSHWEISLAHTNCQWPARSGWFGETTARLAIGLRQNEYREAYRWATRSQKLAWNKSPNVALATSLANPLPGVYPRRTCPLRRNVSGTPYR
jgi:hypothetical protein